MNEGINNLKGIRCPKCGYTLQFKIVGSSWFTVTDDDVVEHDAISWDGVSAVECCRCKRTGIIEQFTTDERGNWERR